MELPLNLLKFEIRTLRNIQDRLCGRNRPYIATPVFANFEYCDVITTHCHSLRRRRFALAWFIPTQGKVYQTFDKTTPFDNDISLKMVKDNRTVIEYAEQCGVRVQY